MDYDGIHETYIPLCLRKIDQIIEKLAPPEPDEDATEKRPAVLNLLARAYAESQVNV